MIKIFNIFKNLNKKVLLPALAALSLCLAGCGEGAGDTLVMGTSGDYPPFEFYQNGELVGLDIAVAKKVTEVLGVTLQIKDMEFPGLIPAMQAGRLDFVMANVDKTPERAEKADFSRPYHYAYATLLVKEDSGIEKADDLEGKNVGVQMGSSWEHFAKESLPGNYRPMSLLPPMVEELKLGRMQAVLLDWEQAKAFADKNPGLKVVVLQKMEAWGSVIVFPKGSPWVEKFNAALDQLEASGELEAIKKEWIGYE